MADQLTRRRATSLDVDAFADMITAVQTAVRAEAYIPTAVADGLCAQLGGVLRDVRASCAMVSRQVDPGADETARQARLMGGGDRLLAGMSAR